MFTPGIRKSPLFSSKFPLSQQPSIKTGIKIPLILPEEDKISSIVKMQPTAQNTSTGGNMISSFFENYIGNPLQEMVKQTVSPTLNEVTQVTTGAALRELEKTITQLPTLLVQGCKIAVYREILPFFIQTIHSSAVYCQKMEEAEGNNINFAGATEKLFNTHEKLTEILNNKNATEHDLLQALKEATCILKEANVHMLGKGLKGEGLRAPISFEELKTQKEEAAIIAPAPLSAEETKRKRADDFITQRDKLVINVERLLKIQAAYYSLNRTAPDVSHLYDNCPTKKCDKKFKKGVFKQLEQDTKTESYFSRFFHQAKSKMNYYLTGLIVGPIVKQISQFGHQEITAQINDLNQEKNVAALRSHLLDSVQSLLTLFNSAYREIMENKKLPCKTMDELIVDTCNQSTDLFLGRTAEEFNTLLAKVLLKKIIGFSPVEKFILKHIDASALVNQGFDLIEQAKYDEQGFSHSLNLSIVKILTQLKETLENPDTTPEKLDKVSKTQKDKITGIFKTLFTSIPLSHCSNPEEIRSVLEQPNVFKQLFDATINSQILLPVAEAGSTTMIEALGRLLQPDFLQDMLNDSLTIMNESFLSQEQVSHETKIETQNKITELSVAVLDIAIEQALKSVAILNPDSESKPANEAISELANATRIFAQEFSEHLNNERIDQAFACKDAFIKTRRKTKERIAENNKIGTTVQREISDLYGVIATKVALLKKDASTEELLTALQELKETNEERCVNFPGYDFVDEGFYEFARHLIKNQAIIILRERVDGLLNIIQKPALLRCGIHLLISQPILRQNGVKDLSK